MLNQFELAHWLDRVAPTSAILMARSSRVSRHSTWKRTTSLLTSNYALYGDVSARANSIYRAFSPRVEIYSIDESFLDVSDVDRSTGVRRSPATSAPLCWRGPASPTCVGIGPTKTLAKLANHVAKKNPELGGVCDLTDEGVRQTLDGGCRRSRKSGASARRRSPSCGRSAAGPSPTCATSTRGWPGTA